jgi:hypothetical protein
VLQDIGLEDVTTFGDSTGRFDLKTVPPATSAAAE